MSLLAPGNSPAIVAANLRLQLAAGVQPQRALKNALRKARGDRRCGVVWPQPGCYRLAMQLAEKVARERGKESGCLA